MQMCTHCYFGNCYVYQEFLEQELALLTQKFESDFTNKDTFIDSTVQELQSLKLQIIQVGQVCLFVSLCSCILFVELTFLLYVMLTLELGQLSQKADWQQFSVRHHILTGSASFSV
jgi:hypothetical protein